MSERTDFFGMWGAEERPVAFRLNCQKVVEADSSWSGMPGAWLKALHFLQKRNRPDWVICGIDEYSLSIGLIIAKAVRVPIFCVVEDPPFTSRYNSNSSFVRRVEKCIRRKTLRTWLRHVQAIFCFIEKEIVSDLITSEVPVYQMMNSPSPLALDWFRNHPSQIRNVSSSLRIGYVGAINERQGMDDLLEIFASARRKVPGLHLRLIGSIEDGYGQRYRERCNELGIDSEIEVTGWLPYEKMLEQLNECDVCVYCNPPSDWFRAAQPLKVCEYLALRKPTVSWDYPGMRRLLDGGRLGILVPAGDKPAFAEALVTLTDPAKRGAIKQEVEEAIQKGWTSDYWYEQMLRILDKTAS